MAALQYVWRTRHGTFRIQQTPRGWVPTFDGEPLSSGYRTPQEALDELAGGHTDWPSCGDPSTMGLSDDLADWEPIRA